MSEQSRKIAVLVENEFIPEEIKAYQETFSQSGYEVQLVSRLWGQGRAKYIGALDPLNYKPGDQPEQLEATKDFDQVAVDDYAAVLIAANYVSVRLRYFEPDKDGNDPRNSPAVRFFARAMRNGRVVKGALCHGLWLLTPVPELLAGRKVICHRVVQADIQNAGGIITVTPNKVTVDGDLVTGYSKDEARALADAVIGQIARLRQQQLNETKVRELVGKWYQLLDVHAPEADLVGLLDAGLEMKLPEGPVHGLAGFRGWYQTVTHAFFDERHVLNEVNVKLSDDRANVDIIVNWQAKRWRPPAAKSESLEFVAAQRWVVVCSASTGEPVVLTYIVDSLTPKPGSGSL